MNEPATLCGHAARRKEGVDTERTIDRDSHEIRAVRLTEGNRHDCDEMQSLVDEVGECDWVFADGAYDNQKGYDAADSHGARAIISPRSGAALTKSPERKPISWEMVQRNTNIQGKCQLGEKEWKVASRYHQRSLAETGIGRFKAIFGPGLRSREGARQ